LKKERRKKMSEGWGWPGNSKKAHYFVNGRSLCGSWIYFGELEQGKDDSSDNCPRCKKRLEAKRRREAK